MRDSAGIRIVEHPGAALARLPEWRVSAEPALTIGGSTDDAESVTEVAGAYLTPDGTIVYADAAAHQVRIHSPDGAHLRSLGRRGTGPGEFSHLTSLWRRSDSAAVYDMSAKRLTVAPLDGSPPRTAALRHAGFLTSVQGSADGRMVTRQLDAAALAGVGADAARVPEHVLVISPDGRSADTILTIAGPATYLPPESPGWDGPAPVGFGPESQLVVIGDSILIGTNEAFEVTTYDLAGTPVRIVRVDAVARAVEADHVNRARQAAWEEFEPRAGNMPPEIVAQFRAFLHAQRYAERFPFHGALATDLAGNLWLQEYAAPGDSQERFTIVGRDGALVARVTLPPGLHFLGANDAHVLGLWRDPDGVQQLRLHAFTR
ncbi:MAG: hypothetical protein ACM357_00925 [Gemmatimonadota bacterium]